MRNWVRNLLAMVLVAVICGISMLALRQPPRLDYQGKSLDFWLAGYDQGNYKVAHPSGPAPPTWVEADEAIRQIGTNALPTLLLMLQEHGPTLTDRAIALVQKQHLIKIVHGPENRDFKAFEGLIALGSSASNAVPPLIALIQRDPVPFTQQCIPVILGHIGPAARQAIPTLLQGTTHSNAMVRNNSIFALRKIHEEPNSVVPALIKCLNDTNDLVKAQAIRALGTFGQDAHSAVPALLAWRKQPSRTDRGGVVAIDGTIVSASWITPTGPFVTVPDWDALLKDALRTIAPDAAANPGIR